MVFSPKGEETLKAEVLEDLGLEYEGNEEMVDKVIQRRLKDEEFKASVHEQKTKAQQMADERKALLEKAGFNPETGEKLTVNTVPAPKNDSLTPKDLIALRDVNEEDLDFLLDEAKLRGKSIGEIKKDPYIKAALKIREEERVTAAATITKSTSKRSSQSTEEKILNDFNSGTKPKSEEEAAALAEAQFKQLLNKSK